MTDAARAAQLAAQAYALWQQDRLEEAVALYRQALECAARVDPALAQYHGELAAVLDALGAQHEAEQALETSLALELALAADPHEVGVVIARYFLAEFLLRHGRIEQALNAVLPHITTGRGAMWLLHRIAAEAFLARGDRDAAEQAAHRALATAPSEDQRSELRLRLLEIGLHDSVV